MYAGPRGRTGSGTVARPIGQVGRACEHSSGDGRCMSDGSRAFDISLSRSADSHAVQPSRYAARRSSTSPVGGAAIAVFVPRAAAIGYMRKVGA